MPKLFKLIIGIDEKYGVADSEEDMEAKKAEVDPAFAYLPVRIEEVQVEGYEITVKQEKKK
jgi:Mg2+/Co2+ transporter CorC